jgi:LuxR family maltose regulon positive regulatory protein
MLPRAQQKGLLGREIELLLIQAQALFVQGEEEAALRAFEKALAVSRASGYIRVFDQSAVLDDLIHRAARKGMCPHDLERILTAIRTTRGRAAGSVLRAAQAEDMREAAAAHVPVVGGLVEPLSERELEVLRLIACGSSNQAIADQFVITIGTVKSHIHHIFGKLGVRNRTEAVAQARKLGLIEMD